LFWFLAILAAEVMSGQQQVEFRQTRGFFPAEMYTAAAILLSNRDFPSLHTERVVCLGLKLNPMLDESRA